jgi:hypothetical protein
VRALWNPSTGLTTIFRRRRSLSRSYVPKTCLRRRRGDGRWENWAGKILKWQDKDIVDSEPKVTSDEHERGIAQTDPSPPRK